MGAVTLYINTTSSRCGACNRNADPSETEHIMVRMQGVGCGAKFEALSTDYYDFEGLYAIVQGMRPDLPFAPVFS